MGSDVGALKTSCDLRLNKVLARSVGIEVEILNATRALKVATNSMRNRLNADAITNETLCAGVSRQELILSDSKD